MTHKMINRYPLGNPHRVWQQDNFVLSTFSARGTNMRDTLENCADAGFNMVELGWATHEQAEEALRLCEELGLPLVFQDFTRFGGMQERHMDRKSTPEEIKAVVDHVRPYKSCIGYYIWDEPYVDDQLAESRRVVDMFQREDPDRCPFTVAIPSYNSKYTWQNGLFAGYLHKYVTIIDPPMLSLDYYPIGLPGYTDEKQLDDSLFWCDLGLMRKLCAQYHLPLWFYYQALNMHGFSHFEFPMARMMMYAAVLYGAKGLQQFTSVGATTNKDGGKGPTHAETKEIHEELKKLGNTLMALDSRYVFHSADLLPGCPWMSGLADDMLDSEYLASPLPTRVSVGELTDSENNRYMLLLNRDFTLEKTISLPLKKTCRLYEVSKATGRQTILTDAADSIDVTLAAGDAILLRIQDSTAEAFTIEYRLEK